MQNLLAELRGHYDWIFIDAASLGAVVDGVILARYADTTLYLVRWLETTRNAVKTTIEQLRDAGANVAGVALSRVDMAASSKYRHLEEIRYYGYYDRTAAVDA
jgi:Mrp family chromosome partitioning ATPase